MLVGEQITVHKSQEASRDDKLGARNREYWATYKRHIAGMFGEHPKPVCNVYDISFITPNGYRPKSTHAVKVL